MRKKVLVAWFSKSVWSVRKESNMSWTVVGFQSPEERQVFRILRSLSCRFGWGDCWKCHWSKLVAASWFRCIRKSQKAMNPNKATCHKADGPHKVDNDNIMTHWQPPKIVAANFAAIKPAHNIRKKKKPSHDLFKKTSSRSSSFLPLQKAIEVGETKVDWPWIDKKMLHHFGEQKLCVLPASCSTIPPVNCWKVHRVPCNLLVDLLVSHRPCPETLARLRERHCQVREVGGNVVSFMGRFVQGMRCFLAEIPSKKSQGLYIICCFVCVFFANFLWTKNSWPIHPCIIMHSIHPILSIHLSFFSVQVPGRKLCQVAVLLQEVGGDKSWQRQVSSWWHLDDQNGRQNIQKLDDEWMVKDESFGR